MVLKYYVIYVFFLLPDLGGSPFQPKLDTTSSVLGHNLTLCVGGDAKGLSSANWTVEGVLVTAQDITDKFPMPNISNYVLPACHTSCACRNEYLAIGSVQDKLKQSLAKFGYAAFVLSYYSALDINADKCILTGHLCSLPDMYLTFLVIQEVSGRPRAMDVKFSISKLKRISYKVHAGKLYLTSHSPCFLRLYYNTCLIVS